MCVCVRVCVVASVLFASSGPVAGTSVCMQTPSPPPHLSEHCIPLSSADTRRHLRSINRHLLAVPHFRLNTYGRRTLSVAGRWPGTQSRILSGIQRAAQTVLGVYLKRTCSRITSASSALGVLNDYALYKSTHSLTHAHMYTQRWTGR